VEFVDNSDAVWLHAVYDKYAGFLFSVLTDLCYSNDDAEIALVHTFVAIPKHENFQQGKPINFISLVKLALGTARQHVAIKDPVCVNCFKQSTLLHYFICEDGTMEALCQQSGLPSTDIARQLHLEIQNMRTSKNDTLKKIKKQS
jgi:hypothetical protein